MNLGRVVGTERHASLDSMIRLTDTESTLIAELLECVSEAIDRAEGVSPQYANKTKLQKLLYFAIEEYDLPITYSWYLAGAVVPDTGVTPERLESPQSPQTAQSLGPDALDRSGEDPKDAESSEIDPIMFSDNTATPPNTPDSVFEFVDRSTLIDFYVSKLPVVWSQNTMRFLQNFYQEAAPPEYRSLYIESTHLRTHLNELVEAVQAHMSGEEPTTPIDELEVQLGRTISDFHYHLRETEALRETFELVVRGTDLIEDAISMLASVAPNEYTSEHIRTLEELQDFFYYYVWRYPCLCISSKTAIGPSAETLASKHRQSFQGFPDRFQSAYRDAAETVRDAGLSPNPLASSESGDDEIARTLIDLSVEYLE